MSINLWDLALDEIKNALSMEREKLKEEQVGLVALIRASAEMTNFVDDPQHAKEVLQQYFELLLCENVDISLVNRICDTLTEGDPRWLEECPDKVSERFPKPLLIMALSRIIPHGIGEYGNRKAFHYLDNANKYCGISHDFIRKFRGWLTGTADKDVRREMISLQSQLEGTSPTGDRLLKLLEPIDICGSHADYLTVKDQLIQKINLASPELDRFQLETKTRENLLQFLKNDRFRLAVLGEFKRGKSTLINALVEVPDFMPTDILPCTSALIELKYGTDEAYEVNEKGPLSEFILSDKTAFRDGAGNANKKRSTQESAEKDATIVPFWRASIPSNFLNCSFISLIDSPGLGEDYARDRIAKAEAERADAAIVVMDTQQIASLQELELLEEMKTKASDIIVAINRGDQIPEEKWHKIKAYAINRIQEKTTAISEDRIVIISAKKGEDAIRSRDFNDIWYKRLDDFREIVKHHLIAKTGRIKLRHARQKTIQFVKTNLEAINNLEKEWEIKFKNLKDLDGAKKKSDEEYEKAKDSIERSVTILRGREGDKFNKDFIKKFFEDLNRSEGIVDSLNRDKDKWESEYSIASPKKLAHDIAEQAQKAFMQRIENWMKEEGRELIFNEIQKRIAEVQNKSKDLIHYVEKFYGLSEDSIEDLIQSKTIKTAFNVDDLDCTGSIATGAAFTALMAPVIGYAIADGLLYYLLGAVVGFFNPVILAAALVAAIPAAWLGQKTLKDFVKRRIVEIIKKETNKDNVRNKFQTSLDTNIEKLGLVLTSPTYGKER